MLVQAAAVCRASVVVCLHIDKVSVLDRFYNPAHFQSAVSSVATTPCLSGLSTVRRAMSTAHESLRESSHLSLCSLRKAGSVKSRDDLVLLSAGGESEVLGDVKAWAKNQGAATRYCVI